MSSFDTITIHGGVLQDSETGSRAVPIYQTSSYVFNSVEHAGNLFALKEAGNIYSRIGNPTTAVLEEELAQLEGGVGGTGNIIRSGCYCFIHIKHS